MKRYREPALLMVPALVLLLVAYLLPVGQVLWLGIQQPEADGGVRFTFENYGRFFTDPYYVGVVWRTLKLSFFITAATVALGFPFAYIALKIAPRFRVWLLALVILPLMTSVVIRTFGWVIVLGRGGIVSDLLQALGLAGRRFQLLQTETGIVIAMVQVLLPFMTITVLGVLLRIEARLEEAARTSGANFYQTMRHVVFPLSMPGIVSGSLLVFTLSVSSFVTPNLIGGVRLPVLASSIYRQATSTLDWNFAAALATILLVMVFLILVPYTLILSRPRGG
jgi:putative spermidine/putrescine transport system permease protein